MAKIIDRFTTAKLPNKCALEILCRMVVSVRGLSSETELLLHAEGPRFTPYRVEKKWRPQTPERHFPGQETSIDHTELKGPRGQLRGGCYLHK